MPPVPPEGAGPAGVDAAGDDAPGVDSEQEAREAAERRRRREAVFGPDDRTSADERDDADRVREGRGGADWYREERPPHHDRP